MAGSCGEGAIGCQSRHPDGRGGRCDLCIDGGGTKSRSGPGIDGGGGEIATGLGERREKRGA